MALWEDWLTNASTWLDVTTTQAGILLSLVFTTAIIITMAISTKGKYALVITPLSALFPMILFTYAGWFPIWIGSAISLVLAIFIAWVISKGF